MPANSPDPTRLYRQACRSRSVWSRAARLGLVVGVVQVLLNQGDHWLTGQITTGVVLKSVLSPLLSFGIAFVSAAATHAENLKQSNLTPVAGVRDRRAPTARQEPI